MNMPLPTKLPSRPEMPNGEQARSTHQQTRLDILKEEHEQVALDWMAEHIDPDRLDNWGPPDLSVNPLADICRQLTTPGLYGRRPLVRHADASADALIGPGGLLDQGGYWTKMQTVQYRALGIGDYIIAPGLDDAGKLEFRMVHPHNVWFEALPSRPDVPVRIHELRLGYHPVFESWQYFWVHHDISDPKKPRRWVTLADTDADGEEEDATDVYAPQWREEGYRWVHPDSDRPLLPYVIYRAADAGEPWNYMDKRGAARATLTSIMNWTATGKVALDASGQMVIVSGLEPMFDKIDVPNDNTARQVRNIQVTPGALVYHRTMEGQQPFVREVGPGSHLQNLLEYSHTYEAKQAVRWGLSPSDVQRQTANPMSGAALYISNRQRREYASILEPLFRRADLQMLELCAVMLRSVGVTVPTSGYSITYAEIEQSPDEQRASREQLQWEIDRGLRSRVDVYQDLHPGTERQHAINELARVRREELLIEQLAGGPATTTPTTKPADPTAG